MLPSDHLEIMCNISKGASYCIFTFVYYALVVVYASVLLVVCTCIASCVCLHCKLCVPLHC